MGFEKKDIIYEDNHLIVVNKRACQPVQADTSGDFSLEDELKMFIKVRDNKPGAVFLGVIHRIDRPVGGVVIFAKTSKALRRMNELVKDRKITKRYLAITESSPEQLSGELKHYIDRNPRKNRSYAYDTPRERAKEAMLEYVVRGRSDKYYLIDVNLITGRHHQIRCQLSKSGCPIKGDLKYGARRSNPDGSISLHAYSVEFEHPVSKEILKITAPVPEDNLWMFFKNKL